MGHEDKKLLARDTNGMPLDIPVAQSKNYNVFEVKKIQVTKGDKIRITGKGKTEDGKQLFNGTTYNIHAFDKEGNIKLSNGSTLSKDYRNFTLGYVSTSHSSQGRTEDKVIISQSSATFRASSMEQFYVSVSRGKTDVAIYTDCKTDLLQAVSQSVQRTSATELLAKTQQNNKAVLERNRLTLVKKVKDKAVETYDYLKSKINIDNGLRRTAPTKGEDKTK